MLALVVCADRRLRVLDRANGRTVSELPCGAPLTSLVERGDTVAVVLGGSQVRWLRIVESGGRPTSAAWMTDRCYSATADGTLYESSIDLAPADLTAREREPWDPPPTGVWLQGKWLLSAVIQVFGAEGHGFKLNTPLHEADVRAFEERYGVTLPDDYRGFLLSIANGGAGPYYYWVSRRKEELT